MECRPIRCERCWQPPSNCFCSQIKTIRAPLRLIILQHPQESRNAKSTARVLVLSLPGTTYRVGLSWRSLTAALGESAVASEWGVLFLGTQRNLDKRKNSMTVIDSKCRILIKGLVVLDGNWKQSKTLWWRNPWLTRLKRVVLSPEGPSQYGNYRREPRKACLSTIESVALCLKSVTQDERIEVVLLNNQRIFIDHVLRPVISRPPQIEASPR